MAHTLVRVDRDDTTRALGDIIGRRALEIEQRWLARVSREVADTPGVELTQLRDGVPDYLKALHEYLSDGDERGVNDAGAQIWLDIAREHGITRVRIGFDVDQLIHEFVVLRHTIREVAAEHEVDAAKCDANLADLFDAAILESVRAYVEARNFEIRRAQAQNIGFLTHELRNPLSAAAQAAALVREHASPDQFRALDVLERSHQRLIGLIDSVLEFERLVSGSVEPKRVDIQEGILIERAVEAARNAGRAKGLAFEVRHRPERVLHVDPDLTVSALQNLVDNAVKYTDRGHVEVVVEQRDDTWSVHVHDTCPGLSPEDLSTIFEPFRRGSTIKPGTGLGLSIARRSIEAQGGSIHAESSAPSGCHFWITLPAKA